MSDRPNEIEVQEFIATFNAIATFVAMRNLWTKPIPAVIKTIKWLEDEFKLTDQDSQAVGQKE